jgi:hypothetical protein
MSSLKDDACVSHALPPDETSAPAAVGDDRAAIRDALVARVVRLRRRIGVVAAALPFAIPLPALWLPNPLCDPLSDDHRLFRTSLSAYYFAGTREVFTCGLAAVGAMLIFHKMFDKRGEFWLTTAAGFLAFGVAVFPTAPPTMACVTPLQDATDIVWIKWVHYGCAGSMIALLAAVCFIWARLENDPKARKREPKYRRLHIASVIVLGLAAAFGLVVVAIKIFGHVTVVPEVLLIVEFLAVEAFAWSFMFVGPAYKERESNRAAQLT